MAHYHPISYETEARIRQREKLANAHRYRQLKATRATPVLRRVLHVVANLLVASRM